MSLLKQAMEYSQNNLGSTFSHSFPNLWRLDDGVESFPCYIILGNCVFTNFGKLYFCVGNCICISVYLQLQLVIQSMRINEQTDSGILRLLSDDSNPLLCSCVPPYNVNALSSIQKILIVCFGNQYSETFKERPPSTTCLTVSWTQTGMIHC